MRYLGIEQRRPKIAVFDFTGCEGCELQLANKESTLVAFLGAVDVRAFREVSSVATADYEVALVEGAITRGDEVERLHKIRQQAKVVVALGSCACFGGVNRQKNAFDLEQANREVYGGYPKITGPTRAIKEIVPVDLEIPGCPVSKDEVERVVRFLILGLPYQFPMYPVCVECRQRFHTCLFDKGQLCLGSITRAGCAAPCPAGGLGCWGCRGPTESPNFRSFLDMVQERGFPKDLVAERLGFFGGFEVTP
ncbi:MAG: NADH:ubiquinone oxidoreductase [Pseudomonadota bacterium]